MAIMAPIWGAFADRRGRKAMLVWAQFALAVSNAASAAIVAPWQLVGVRAVQGGFSGVVGASRALVATTVPRDRVSPSLGMVQSAIFMGQTLGPAAGGLIGGALGFRSAFLMTAGVNLVDAKKRTHLTPFSLPVREGGQVGPSAVRRIRAAKEGPPSSR